MVSPQLDELGRESCVCAVNPGANAGGELDETHQLSPTEPGRPSLGAPRRSHALDSAAAKLTSNAVRSSREDCAHSIAVVALPMRLAFPRFAEGIS